MTIVYWMIVGVAMFLPYYFIPGDKKMVRAISVSIIFFIGIIAYQMYFEQMFAKKYGGTQVITIPEGERFMGISWKDDNFWLITHEYLTNTCYYRENSKYSALEGTIKIKDCNPIYVYPSKR